MCIDSSSIYSSGSIFNLTHMMFNMYIFYSLPIFDLVCIGSAPTEANMSSKPAPPNLVVTHAIAL